MKTIHLTPVPDSYYKYLGYPSEGKCSDLVVIKESEADEYHKAAFECFSMLDKAVERVISEQRLSEFGIPKYMHKVVERTYEEYQYHPHMIGRFDFSGGLDGVPIKLIEFNADTPFSIFETSTVQYALAKFHGLDPDNRQYNRLFEELTEFFSYLHACLPKYCKVLFTNAEDGEDDLNTKIIMEASKNILDNSEYHHWTDVCVDANHGLCTVNESGYIESMYGCMIKMVPWDLLISEDPKMCRHIIDVMECNHDFVVCNPPYAAVFQNKLLLKEVYEMYPDSKYLLKTSDKELSGVNQVVKPAFGREGCNITITKDGSVRRTDGMYGNQPMIYQELADFNVHDGKNYQAGVFISMETPCALAFRRSESPIITTNDELVGHIFDV